MTPVFRHGRLRLYLLKLLAEEPKHGYELIRSLENRFLGRYAPSAGTIYPRLQRLEADGLVTHTAAGGRKVYEITDAGQAELAARAAELAAVERDIHASVADLGPVRRSVRDVRREPRQESGEVGQRAQALPEGGRAELEQRATILLAEVRRLVRQGSASAERVRAAVVVLETALDQVRRLLR